MDPAIGEFICHNPVHKGQSGVTMATNFGTKIGKAITRVQTSPIVDISRNSNGRISVIPDATVTCLGRLVVLHVLCMLMWPWPEPRSRSRSRTSWTSDNCPQLHISRSISSVTFAWSSKLMV